MKNVNSNKNWAEDRLSPSVLDRLLDLEMVLTNSAYGHAYAEQALEETGEFGEQSERLKLQLEGFKERYFDARVELNLLDANRLENLEKNLQAQKMILFYEHKNRVLH